MVLSLRQGDFQLQRLGLAFDAQAGGYLLLAPVEGVAELPVAAIDAVRRARPVERGGPQRVQSPASLVGTGDVAGRYEYRAPGPVRVGEIALLPAETNSVASVVVESRDDAAATWRERARFVVFRVADGRGEVGSEPIAVSADRDRHWRVSSVPPLSAAPALTLTWHSESFVLLAQGPGPFRVVAGSPSIRNPEFPVAELGVYLNRLRQDILLQADPTVQYAVGYLADSNSWWKNPLFIPDLELDSQYNTYVYPGLPPGPNANPGLSALQGVAEPVQTSFLFFVADCTNSTPGAHLFSETYDEHLAQVELCR